MARRARHVQRRRRGPVLAAGGLVVLVALATVLVSAVRAGDGLRVGPDPAALNAGAPAPLTVLPPSGDEAASRSAPRRTSRSAGSRESAVRRAVAAALK